MMRFRVTTSLGRGVIMYSGVLFYRDGPIVVREGRVLDIKRLSSILDRVFAGVDTQAAI